MRQAWDVSVLAAFAVPIAAGWAAERLPPRRAAFLLLLCALGAAASWVWAVGLAAFLLVSRSPLVGQLGHWSVRAVRTGDPMPIGLSVLACLAVVVGVAGALLALRGAYPSLAASRGLAGLPRVDRLSILADGPPTAATLPGLPGRVVISATLLRDLTPDEVRVVLAHERCHLTWCHWLFKLAARLAAGVAPFTRPLMAPLDAALERWADESAARAVGDRRLAARAVAHAALLIGASQPLGVTGGPVSARVAALLVPPTPSRWLPMTVPLMLVAVSVLLGVEAGRDVEGLFDVARHVQAVFGRPVGSL